jgi:hypothetical protein
MWRGLFQGLSQGQDGEGRRQEDQDGQNRAPFARGRAQPRQPTLLTFQSLMPRHCGNFHRLFLLFLFVAFLKIFIFPPARSSVGTGNQSQLGKGYPSLAHPFMGILRRSHPLPYLPALQRLCLSHLIHLHWASAVLLCTLAEVPDAWQAKPGAWSLLAGVWE